MKKYYQVFLSSASREFDAVRDSIIHSIMKQDKYFPVAMELMAASSHTFEMLYSYMKSSDVCVLLLGEKPGSQIGRASMYLTDPDMLSAVEDYMRLAGISDPSDITYTEFEIAVARKLGIEVLLFVKKSAERAIEDGVADPISSRLYRIARERAAYHSWDSEFPTGDLTAALNRHFETSHAVGWIRETDSAIYRSAMLAGITDISLEGKLSDDKLVEWLGGCSELKLFYTTGRAFVLSHTEILANFVAQGGNVKLLCCEPDTQVLDDIRILEERLYGDRAGIHREYPDVLAEFRNIYRRAEGISGGKELGSIRIGLCSTLFRSSVMICESGNGGVNYGWLTVTLPPAKSRETVSFEMRSRPGDDMPNNLLNRSLDHFNAVWDFSEKTGGVISVDDPGLPVGDEQNDKDYWRRCEAEAISAMRKRKRYKGVLIEVAAQHPLEDGMYPGEEFRARLDRAMELYRELTDGGCRVELYVPGSVHLDPDGVPDERSLSEAGCEYLTDHGIPTDAVHGEDLNGRYDSLRHHTGVYNTADECFIASNYFREEGKEFGQLYSVCSPNQLMRKNLFYISFGVIPKVVTVPLSKMYHNFLRELTESVPYILETDHDYQSPDSKEALRTRRERMPDYNE